MPRGNAASCLSAPFSFLHQLHVDAMEFTQSIMSPAEAELLVRQLKPISIDKVGTVEWKDQRSAVERLNMCAHSNAALKKDDYVRSYLIDHEKMLVLLHELLTMEVWRHEVFPKVSDEIAANPSGIYMYCYYEAILLNLLECIMYFEEAVGAFGDDITELIDYLWRQVSAYCANGMQVSQVVPDLDPKTATDDMKKNLERQLYQQSASRTMTCISCLWFVVERISQLPMAVTNSLLIKNDIILGFSEVMVLQVWQRRGPGKVQKYIQGQFRDVPNDDVLRVCVPEAHCWFILHKLLCDRECRKKYTYTSSKKEIILRIKRHLNETIVDQIPVLTDVQRALEELSFMEAPSGTEEKFKSTLIIEQVPRIMAAIDNKQRNWGSIASETMARLRDPNSKRDDAMRLAQIFDLMFEKEEGGSDRE